ATIIGAADDGHLRLALLGWALLAFVVAVALAEPARPAPIAAGIGGALVYMAGVSLQAKLNGGPFGGTASARVLLLPALALLVAPLLLRLLLDRIELTFRQVQYQASVIDDLT